LQTKLLRFLQDGEIRRLGDTETRKVNVRLVAATARDLEREVAGGRFREDLFYRLNVIRIHVPPLRERRGDIPLLASHFLSHYCGKYGKREMLLSADALEALSGHEWRGNVRELRNVMERCALLASGAEVSRAGLLAVWKGSGASGGRSSGPALEIRVPVSPERPDLKAAVRELERQLIRIALERTGGSRPKAAELLGISHPTLLYKAKEFGIEGG
jgi:two-component system response regulator AtoC